MVQDPDRYKGRRLIAATIATIGSFALINYIVFVLPNPARAAANWAANPGGLLFLTAIVFAPYAVIAWAACYIGLMFIGPWKDD